MSFDKKYKNRKDWRREYYGSRAVDATCRCHGTCPWCQGNRKFKHKRRVEDIKNLIDELGW